MKNIRCLYLGAIFSRLILFITLLLSAACYHIEPALLPGEDTAPLQAYYLKGKQYELDGLPFQAYSSYLKAAKKGYAPAQAALGFLVLKSTGDDMITVQDDDSSLTTRKVSRAELWFELAAKQDDASAKYGLGRLYFYGLGKAVKNIEKALYWYEQAAEQDYLDAQTALAAIYYNVAKFKNNEKAIFYWEKAAQQGDIDSLYYLGVVYHNAKQFEIAKQWYKQAIAKGHYGADINFKLITGELGHYPCYMHGYFGPVRQPGIARYADDWCIKPAQ